MRLTDLNPVFVSGGGNDVSMNGEDVVRREGVGVMLDCPCGAGLCRLYVPFANPLDGGPPTGRIVWERTGETFETLTLTPSIRRLHSRCDCEWHGYITNGEIITV
jgi:hypothetical protein